jgi:acetyl esterase
MMETHMVKKMIRPMLVAVAAATLLSGCAQWGHLSPGGGGGAVMPPPKPTAEMANVLTAIASFDAPKPYQLEPQAARNLPSIPEWTQQAGAQVGVPITPEPVGDVRNIVIPVDGAQLLARVYAPAVNGPLPVLVYFHGGGWVIANLNTYDASARALANRSGRIVVSVAYRQAPEHPFPTPMNDAYESFEWVKANAAAIGGDPADVAVGGESAGGNLAAVVALRARNESAPLPSQQLLIYPITDRNFDTPSYRQNAQAVPLDRPTMEYFWDNYLPDPTSAADPYASPLRADDLADLPPATVILAEIDPLRSEGASYARGLSTAGVPTNICLYRGVTHEFFGMTALLPEARAAQAVAATALRGEPVPPVGPCDPASITP